MTKKLVIIPSDPISDYEKKGTSSWLKEYYNPNLFFDEVYVLSPKEREKREVYGLKIIPIQSNRHFKNLVKKICPLYVRAYGGYWATDYANYNRVAKIPVVSSVHDTNVELLYESLKFSDAVFVMSQVIKGLIEKEFGRYDTLVLGNRVDTEKFKKEDIVLNNDIGFLKDKIVVLHVGRKSYEKNIETTIKALNYLDDKFVLILIGKGNTASYKKLADKISVLDRIKFIEKVENNDLVNWYNRANVLCVPSRWEGFGIVFIEAASCLTKIVTSNIAPMNEYLINDGVMNMLVDDYEDPKQIANAIMRLFNAKLINQDTRDIIIKNFDKKVIANKELDFYKKTIYKLNTKKIAYYKWYYKRRIKHEYLPTANKIFKLPRRIWRFFFKNKIAT